MDVNLRPLTIQQQLQTIATAIQTHERKDEDVLHLINNHLIDDSVYTWTDSSTGLNLFQLAIFNQKRGVVNYLLGTHPMFLCKCLYTHKERSYLVNHPFHLACWLGDKITVKAIKKCSCFVSSKSIALTFPAVVVGPSQCHFCQKSPDLKDLMTSVSVIHVGSSADHDSVPKGVPLELAVISAEAKCVRYLLSFLLQWLSMEQIFFPDPDPRIFGATSSQLTFQLACYMGCPSVVSLLLQSQPIALESPNQVGLTPLHLAVCGGNTDTIRLLLERGADVNARIATMSSATCFHVLYRSHFRRPNLVANTRLLLQYSADVTACDNETNVYGEQFKENKGRRGLTPIQLLVEEFVASTPHKCRFDKSFSKCVGEYTDSNWQDKLQSLELEEYLSILINCMRLVLEAGADPSMLTEPVPSFGGRDCVANLLDLATLSLERKQSVLVQSVLPLMFEFGATVNCCLNSFLLSVMPKMKKDLQVQYVHLLCRNGVSGSDICWCIWSHQPQVSAPHGCPFRHNSPEPSAACLSSAEYVEWDTLVIEALVNLTPVSELQHIRTLPKQLTKKAFDFESGVGESAGDATQSRADKTKSILSPLFGTPVRSLRHSCKLAVIKALQNKCSLVDEINLPLPVLIRNYLKENF